MERLSRAGANLSLVGNVFLCLLFNYLNYRDIYLLQIDDSGMNLRERHRVALLIGAIQVPGVMGV